MDSTASSPLADLLTRKKPQLSTRKALLILDVQNDLLQPTTSLPVQSSQDIGSRLEQLVPSFRRVGQIIWIRSVFEDRQVFRPEASTAGGSPVLVASNQSTPKREPGDSDDEDDAIIKAALAKMRTSSSRPSTKRTTELLERMSLSSKAAAYRDTPPPPDLFLSQMSKDGNLCRKESPGMRFIPAVRRILDVSRDAVFLKSSYSAFQNTDLLSHLRSRLITELYLCGCYTNVSVYATASIAASHGLKVVLIEDCLAFCNTEAHNSAVSRMIEQFGATVVSSQSLVDTTVAKPPEVHTLDPVPAPRSSPSSSPIERVEKPSIMPKRAQYRSMAAHTTVLSSDEKIGEGDSSIFHAQLSNLLHQHQSVKFSGGHSGFNALNNEICWQKLYHATGQVPRLVCAQGQFEADGSVPVYRHPSDTLLPLLHYSPLVSRVRRRAEQIVGHRLNHCLIQLYRGGEDFISEHSDKTLDIVCGTSIVNVSFGAQRTMRLRTKKSAQDEGVSRTSQLVPLPDGSVFVLGPKTNAAWLHGINHDKRPLGEKSTEEKAFGGQRISLTFRCIGTFMTSDCRRIYGQGGTARSRDNAREIVTGNDTEQKAIIRAFGAENQSTVFDWDCVYGRGFDNLDLSRIDVDGKPTIFWSGSWTDDLQIRLCLETAGVEYEVGGVPLAEVGEDYHPDVCLRDINDFRTQISGALNVLQYLHRFYWRHGADSSGSREAEYAQLLYWVHEAAQSDTSAPSALLPVLEAYATCRVDSVFDSTGRLQITDCMFWPLSERLDDEGLLTRDEWPAASRYHWSLSQSPIVHKVLWQDATA